MAKRMSKSSKQTVSQKDISKKKDTQKMVSKVEVKKPQDQEKVSRVVGTIFIIIGVVLVGLGIFSYVKYRENPEFDGSLKSPSIVGINRLTNGKEITVQGVAEEYDQVVIYVDDTEVKTVKVAKDKGFEYIYEVDDEGKYAVTVAGVKGFPKRVVSPKSNSEVVVVDWTAPEILSLEYSSEVGTETFTVIGTTEEYAEVSLKRGVDSYSGIANEDGKFKITQIGLEEGPNVFNVETKDTAGNVGKNDEKVRVEYVLGASINGDAVVDTATGETDLPVAAGNLSHAQDIILGNTLMMVFGLLALMGFVTSGVLYYKKQS
jgi:hypothetical protein